MRNAKFNVPVIVLPEFLDFINSKGLKSTIVSKKDDVYNVEIPYTKEQAHIIDEMEELVEVLVVLTVVTLSALSILAAASQNQQAKKRSPSKTLNKNHCFFKDLLLKNEKKETQKSK